MKTLIIYMTVTWVGVSWAQYNADQVAQQHGLGPYADSPSGQLSNPGHYDLIKFRKTQTTAVYGIDAAHWSAGDCTNYLLQITSYVKSCQQEVEGLKRDYQKTDKWWSIQKSAKLNTNPHYFTRPLPVVEDNKIVGFKNVKLPIYTKLRDVAQPNMKEMKNCKRLIQQAFHLEVKSTRDSFKMPSRSELERNEGLLIADMTMDTTAFRQTRRVLAQLRANQADQLNQCASDYHSLHHSPSGPTSQSVAPGFRGTF